MKFTILLLALILPLLVLAPLSAGAQTVATAGSAAPATFPAATTSPTEKTITVKVVLEGAAEARLPEAALTLYALAGQSPVYSREGKTDAAGTAEFGALPYQDGYGFGVIARVGLTTYISELITPAAGAAEVRVPVQVYPTTTDTSRLRISQVFVLAEAQSPGKLDLTNLYIISNDGSKTVEGGLKGSEGQPASLSFPLPQGAENIQFEGDDGTNFSQIEGGFVTRPGVPPGESSARVAVRYSLPYTDSLRLETRLGYPVDKLTVFVATQGITLTSSLLQSLGTQQREDGVTMNVWGAEQLAADQEIAYEFSGEPQQAPPPLPASAAEARPVRPGGLAALLEGRSPRELAGAGLLAVGLLLGVSGGIWWTYRSRLAPDPLERQAYALVSALVDLEEDHEAGQVGAAEYEYRRVRLHEALAALVAAVATPEPEVS